MRIYYIFCHLYSFLCLYSYSGHIDWFRNISVCMFYNGSIANVLLLVMLSTRAKRENVTPSCMLGAARPLTLLVAMFPTSQARTAQLILFYNYYPAWQLPKKLWALTLRAWPFLTGHLPMLKKNGKNYKEIWTSIPWCQRTPPTCVVYYFESWRYSERYCRGLC
jgi:hypothetical protein